MIMRPRRSPLAGTLVTIGGLLLPGCLQPDRGPVAEPPAIVVRDAAQEFGRVDQGTPVTRRFTVRNAGGLELSLDTLRTPCDCTASAAARTVPPGDETTIEVRCETRRAVGDMTRTVTVYSNDPRQPVTALSLTGTVALEAAADPAELFVGRVRRGQEVPGAVRMLTGSAAAPAIGPVDARGRVLTAALVDTPSGKRLQLAIRPDAPLGRFDEIVTVHTASPRIAAIEVPVTGTVVGDLTISPAELYFRSASGRAGPTRVVALRNSGNTPVHITEVTMSPPLGTVQVQTIRPGQEYHVVVALDDTDMPVGRVEGTLQVHTDHPQESVVVVPFAVRIVKR